MKFLNDLDWHDSWYCFDSPTHLWDCCAERLHDNSRKNGVYFRILSNDSSENLTYLLADQDAREAILIDPHGTDLPLLLALLAERDLRLRWVLRTHHHDALQPQERKQLLQLKAP